MSVDLSYHRHHGLREYALRSKCLFQSPLVDFDCLGFKNKPSGLCFLGLLWLGYRLRGAEDNFYLVAELKYCSITVIFFSILWTIFGLLQTLDQNLIESPISSIMVMFGCLFLYISTVVSTQPQFRKISCLILILLVLNSNFKMEMYLTAGDAALRGHCAQTEHSDHRRDQDTAGSAEYQGWIRCHAPVPQARILIGEPALLERGMVGFVFLVI